MLIANKELLDAQIQKSGLKKVFLAQSLGISNQSFHQKLNGSSSFRKSEVYVLRDLLSMTDEDVEKIFSSKSQ